MISLKRIGKSHAGRNALASYVEFVSVAGCGFLSIPIAVHHLNKEQLGLWALVNSVLSYLVWMDLGLGVATARKIAPAVAARDRPEIDRWWTLSRTIMSFMGLVVMCLGFGIVPLVLHTFHVSDSIRDDARHLIWGAIIIAGMAVPMRGVSGLFTAQGRYHWSPMGNSISIWVNLLVFYLMLRAGQGLISYFWAMLATNVFLWSYYSILIYLGPDRPRVDFSGLRWSRAKDLLSYSLNAGGMGLVDSISTSLPSMVIGRLGGLSLVPVFAISSRGPTLLTGLVRKTIWAFYPTMLRMQVQGQGAQLLTYHRRVGELTIGFGLLAAGGVMAFNETLVVFLAGKNFYAGHLVTALLAAMLLVEPVSRLYRIMLSLSGTMGHAALTSFAAMVAALAAAVGAYKVWGLSGIAVSLAVQPLVMGLYGFFKGSKSCGFKRGDVSPHLVWLIAPPVAALVGCGFILAGRSGQGNIVTWMGRDLLVPSVESLLIGGLFMVCGASLVLRTLLLIKRGRPVEDALQAQQPDELGDAPPASK